MRDYFCIFVTGRLRYKYAADLAERLCAAFTTLAVLANPMSISQPISALVLIHTPREIANPTSKHLSFAALQVLAILHVADDTL